MAKALALPLVSDHNCTFAAGPIGADAEAAHANLFFLAGIVTQCDERDLPLVVNVSQSLEHIVAHLHLAKEAIPPRPWRQALDEGALQSCILLANWTN